MDPQIEALDNQIKQTDTVKSLHDRDEEIIKDLDGLKEGQAKLNDKVNSGFDKGRKRMDEIEDEMKKGFDNISQSHNDLAREIKDTRISDLTKKLDTKASNDSNIKNGVIVGLTLLLLGAVFTIALNFIGITKP